MVSAFRLASQSVPRSLGPLILWLWASTVGAVRQLRRRCRRRGLVVRFTSPDPCQLLRRPFLRSVQHRSGKGGRRLVSVDDGGQPVSVRHPDARQRFCESLRKIESLTASLVKAAEAEALERAREGWRSRRSDHTRKIRRTLARSSARRRAMSLLRRSLAFLSVARMHRGFIHRRCAWCDRCPWAGEVPCPVRDKGDR
jgi:hypothetical protein